MKAPNHAMSRYSPILRLSTPLIALFLVQTLANLAALAFLGHLGNAVLAGVGAANVLYGVVLALLNGFDTGVQALIARATGAGSKTRPGEALADAWAAAIPLGLLLAVGFWLFVPAALAAMLPDKTAVAAGAAMARAMAPSMLFLALTIPMNAAWVGSGRPSITFLVTVVTATAQVALTWVLVVGVGPFPSLGAAGAGWAGTLDTLVGVFVQLFLAVRLRLVPRWSWPSLGGVLELVGIGWPISLQQSFAQFGGIVAFAIVAQLGVAQAAIINVLLSLTVAPIQMAAGFGVAVATLVGQALGRGDADGARRWGWRTAAVGALLTAPLGLLGVVAPEWLLSGFLHDPATLALAVLPTRIAGVTVALDSAGRILSFAFRGAGATKIAAAAPFVSQWLIQLPLMWWVGLQLRHGVTGVVLVQLGFILLEAAFFAWIWSGSVWTRGALGGRAPAATLPSDARRIAILGGSGSGKSTLARRIGEARGLPVVHLDRLVYGAGWRRLSPEHLRTELAAAIAGGAWVVDGTFQEASTLTLPVADAVLWLDQPTWLRLWRTWGKTRRHRGLPRADRPDGCEEAFGWSYARDVLTFGHWSAHRAAQLSALAGRPIIRVRGDRAIAALLPQPQLSTVPRRRAAEAPRTAGAVGRSVGAP
jgi:putative MATE family efflux protein